MVCSDHPSRLTLGLRKPVHWHACKAASKKIVAKKVKPRRRATTAVVGKVLRKPPSCDYNLHNLLTNTLIVIQCRTVEESIDHSRFDSKFDACFRLFILKRKKKKRAEMSRRPFLERKDDRPV